jgi:hypothetical protein
MISNRGWNAGYPDPKHQRPDKGAPTATRQTPWPQSGSGTAGNSRKPRAGGPACDAGEGRLWHLARIDQPSWRRFVQDPRQSSFRTSTKRRFRVTGRDPARHQRRVRSAETTPCSFRARLVGRPFRNLRDLDDQPSSSSRSASSPCQPDAAVSDSTAPSHSQSKDSGHASFHLTRRRRGRRPACSRSPGAAARRCTRCPSSWPICRSPA